MLLSGVRPLEFLAALHGPVNHFHELGAPAAQRVHGAGLDQAFQNAFVHQARIHGIAKLKQGVEAAQPPTGLQDAVHGIFAHIFDGRQAEADGFADGREIDVARIYVRGHHGDAHFPRFADIFHHLFGVAGFRCQQRGHEFDRVVRLEPGRLVGQQGVGAGMRLIEAVAGKFGN